MAGRMSCANQRKTSSSSANRCASSRSAVATSWSLFDAPLPHGRARDEYTIAGLFGISRPCGKSGSLRRAVIICRVQNRLNSYGRVVTIGKSRSRLFAPRAHPIILTTALSLLADGSLLDWRPSAKSCFFVMPTTGVN